MADQSVLLLNLTRPITTLGLDFTFAGGEIVDISSWRNGSKWGPRNAMIFLRGDNAADQTIAGLELYGHNSLVNGSVWFKIGAFPTSVIVSTTKSLTLPVSDLPAICTEIALKATSISVGQIVGEIIPLDTVA